MGTHVETIAMLLLIACLVAMVARRLCFPYTVGLLVAGIGLAFAPLVPDLSLTKELIFTCLLPPLIFEAALFLHWHALRGVMVVATVLASVGLILAALVTALGMHYLLGWPWLAASVFGVLIAATDPVSVIATFKEAGVTGKLRILVEAESLFNDGVAAVLFALLLAMASGSTPSPAQLSLQVVWVIGAGMALGGVIACATLYIAGKTQDHLVELAFTTVAAYGSFLLAEHFHCSGVLATLTAGLVIGNRGHFGAISTRGREALTAFWEFAAFVANSLIFILIGIAEARQSFAALAGPALVAIVLVLAGRVVAIYPLAALFARTRHHISMAHQHVLVWGGLRGALALALAMGLPPDMPMRSAIVTVTFAIVAFSVVVQGLTMSPLMQALGLLGAGDQTTDKDQS